MPGLVLSMVDPCRDGEGRLWNPCFISRSSSFYRQHHPLDASRRGLVAASNRRPVKSATLLDWLPIATLVLAQKPFALALAIGKPGHTSYGTGQDLASSLRRDTSVERDTKRKLWQSLDPAEPVMVLMKVQIAVVSNDQLRTEDARQKVGIAGDAGAVRRLVITPDFDERLAEKITRAVLVQFPTASPGIEPGGGAFRELELHGVRRI